MKERLLSSDREQMSRGPVSGFETVSQFGARRSRALRRDDEQVRQGRPQAARRGSLDGPVS